MSKLPQGASVVLDAEQVKGLMSRPRIPLWTVAVLVAVGLVVGVNIADEPRPAASCVQEGQ